VALSAEYQLVSSKIGIIVDGAGDFAAIKARFQNGYKIIKTDGPRGHTAILCDILTNSKKQIAMLKAFSCRKVIVMFDFENRSEDYDDFRERARETFNDFNFGIPVSLAIPNRMIENWYLADIAHLSKEKVFLKRNLKQKNYEGKNGKNELKKCFTKKYTYSETNHGPQLFSSLRFNVAKINSRSFKLFLDLFEDSEKQRDTSRIITG
jgi:hypothetical protein